MEELARHHVIWHEQEGNYEVHINRPGIVGRLGFPPDTAEWFAWLERIPSFRFHGKLGHFTAGARKPGSEAASTGSPIAMSKASGDKHYIGVPATITIARLEEIAGDLERLTIPEADA